MDDATERGDREDASRPHDEPPDTPQVPQADEAPIVSGDAEGPELRPSHPPEASAGPEPERRGLLATLRRHEGKAWAAALLATALVIGVGLVVAPEVFWDRFLWEDVWGPTLTDARGVGTLCWQGGEARPAVGGSCPAGSTAAHSGYTITSEIFYGLVLAALLYGIYQHVLRRHGVDTGGGFILGLLPLILLGSAARVLEDACVFAKQAADCVSAGGRAEPGFFAPFFISPWIYFQIAVYALAFLGVAVAIRDADGAWRRRVVASVLAAETAVYAAVTAGMREEFKVVAPWPVFAVVAAAAFALFLATERNAASRFHGTVAALGIPLLAPSVWLMGVWVLGEPWAYHGRGLAPLAGAIMLALAATVTFLVGWLARRASATRPHAMRLAGASALALVFGHMLDGFATWIALKDPFHLGLGVYEEKHPVSDFLLQAFNGTALEDTFLSGILFPVAKLAMVLTVVWLLAREFESGSEKESTLGGLVTMAVFVLGFAPGMRDLLLVAMGF
ncbi:MAG TPA: DUF63 family protein [Candidatus Thermoplasmatota archaeon]|nr:DUF63 family protein [Candidatus Thermoplasmatota archaeon]